jgi:hypothetical protein
MCINISGPPESSLMKPKPRSAFHIFKVPLGIYFPFLSPSFTNRADGLATNCMLSATIALIAVPKRGPLCPLNDL